MIFGYHAMLLDYNIGNQNVGRAHGLHRGLGNNAPGAIPEFNPSPNAIRSYMKQHGTPRTPGLLLRDEPAARGMVLASTEFGDAAAMIGRKLGCALYYREKGAILPETHRIHTSWHQVQASGMQNLTDYLAEALTNLKVGTKANVKQYGDRLTIRTGESEDGLFGYAVQFGQGLIVWGVIAEAGVLEGTLALGDTWPVFGEHEAQGVSGPKHA